MIATADASGRADTTRAAYRFVVALLITAIPIERLAIPLGGSAQIPVNLLCSLGLLAYGVRSGVLAFDSTRTKLYALACASLVLGTIILIALGHTVSLFSVVFVLVLYPLATVTIRGLGDDGVARAHRLFVSGMAVIAVVGIGQFVIQTLGAPYQDYLSVVVPKPFLLKAYNTGDPVTYGSSLYRSNGVLFLEPSFYSFFLGLAVIIALYRKRNAFLVLLLLVGIVPSVAGNGIVMVIVGIAALAYSRHRRNLTVLVLPGLLAVAITAATPLAGIILSRSTEVNQTNTSSSLRLVQPYTVFIPEYLDNPQSIAIGRGAGAVTARLSSFDDPLVAPIVPKLLYEYGALGAIPFLLFLLFAIWGGRGERPWALPLLIGFGVVNPSFLQSTMVLAAIIFGRILRGPVYDRPEPEPHVAPVPAGAHRLAVPREST